ncbi:Long-chain base-1-phosphate phosphatase [Lecanora helva]
MLTSPESNVNPTLKLVLQTASCCYATSIVLGRLYCGMHGFFDVVVGSALGAFLAIIQCLFCERFDQYIYAASWKPLATVVLIILILVRIHPEPADDCPCFDDSVAFAGVAIGVEIGNWHFGHSGHAWNEPAFATVPFDFGALGWGKTIARITLGVIAVFSWREIMKPTMLRSLPPVFRVIERLGLSLPRKFFVQASEYKKVPSQLKDDNVIPPVSEIPSMLNSFRHPRKSRSISVGPQSEADAYEALAYRNRRRRQSKTDMPLVVSNVDEWGRNRESSPDYFGISTSNSKVTRHPTAGLPTPAPSNLDLQRSMTGAETALYTPLTPTSLVVDSTSSSRRPSEERRQDEREEKEMFSKLEKPRVRYDVEVITKLVVYTGIAWISVEGAPLLFETIGLGLSGEPG